MSPVVLKPPVVCADAGEGIKATNTKTTERNEEDLRNAVNFVVFNLKMFPPNPDLDERERYLSELIPTDPTH